MGVVEVCLRNLFRPMCGLPATVATPEAQVVCNQLGFPSTTNGNT